MRLSWLLTRMLYTFWRGLLYSSERHKRRAIEVIYALASELEQESRAELTAFKAERDKRRARL